MTKIVGVDFGTTNVRIAQWDADSGETPSSCTIGDGRVSWMPTVIAFRRHDDGSVETLLGEAADALETVSDVQEVIRNIKRYALASDEYVRNQLEWNLQQQDESPPRWFDPDTRSIKFWNETMPVEEAIRQILKESISRAGLAGTAAEWRAGCPVSSDLVYRKALVSALEDLGCTGRIEWISKEPLLLLALGRAIGSLDDGYYIIYDLGGGSFDCAVVEVKNDQLIVLADEGLPALGGMDIDDMLVERLGYGGPIQLLRIAKEQLSYDDTAINLGGGFTLTIEDVNDALDRLAFMDKTLGAMLNAYHKAQLLMPDHPESDGVEQRRELSINNMSERIDRVLVIGGPTQMPYFTDKLGEIFGTEKVVTADYLTRASDRADIPDPALTALSHGACYMYGNKYTPLTVDRIPAKITLSVTDSQSIEEDSYEPFRRLPFRPPWAPYEGTLIIRRSVYPHESTILNSDRESTFSILITSPDGNTIYASGPQEMRMPRREGCRGPRADRIQLVVDRLGGVKVKLGAGFTHVRGTLEGTVDIILNPPWQPELTPEIGEQLREGRKRLEQAPAARGTSGNQYGTSVHAAYGDSQRRA